MNEHVTASMIAERLLLRPEGATMDEIIAATGGAQYNVLRRLKARRFGVRSEKEGRRTRYFASAPAATTTEAALSGKGQVIVPKAILEAAGLKGPGTVAFSVEDDGRISIRGVGPRLSDLRGILPRPKQALSIEEMDEAVARAASADHFGVRRRSS